MPQEIPEGVTVQQYAALHQAVDLFAGIDVVLTCVLCDVDGDEWVVEYDPNEDRTTSKRLVSADSLRSLTKGTP